MFIIIFIMFIIYYSNASTLLVLNKYELLLILNIVLV